MRKCENILVMDHGSIVESGTYDQLMEKRGKFYALAVNQVKEGDKDQISLRRVLSESAVAAKNAEKKVKKSDEELQEERLSRIRDYEGSIFMRLFDYNRNERLELLVSVLASVVVGAIQPLYALWFADIIAALITPNTDINIVNRIALFFLLIGIASGICDFVKFALFNVIGEKLTMRLRVHVFDRMVRLPVPFFDSKENAPGALVTNLAKNTQNVNRLTSSYVALTM